VRNQFPGGRSPGSRKRPALLWLLVPYVLFLVVLPLVNRVTPTVLGLPLLFFWMLVATLLTPVSVWLARRADLKRGRT
jgi:predicted ABC-type exoprotein transport system permease subunit